MGIVEQAKRLVERARWKEEGWDRPDPPEVLGRWAKGSGVHVVHFSEVGPGQETTSPNDPDSDADPRPRKVGGFKVGVNPESHYNTPIGVYGYPLNRDTYDRWFDGEGMKPPFAQDRPWMYVLEATGRVVRLDESGSAGWSRSRLRDAFSSLVEGEPAMVREAIASITGEWDVPERMTGGAVMDTEFYEGTVGGAKLGTTFAKWWNLTRKVADYGGNGASTWTELLVEYSGIDTVVDMGSGIVHDNEKTQAVFLNPRSYEGVDVVQNIWQWKKRKRKRDHKRIKREVVDDSKLSSVSDKVELKFSGMSPDGVAYSEEDVREVFRGLVDVVGRIDWAMDIIRGASPMGGDRITVQPASNFKRLADPQEDGVSIKGAAVDGVTLSGEVVYSDDQIMFSNCRFTNSTLDEGLSVAIHSESGVNPFVHCEFVGCTLEVDSLILKQRAGIDLDGYYRALQETLRTGDVSLSGVRKSEKDFQKDIRSIWGTHKGAGKYGDMFEDCELEVIGYEPDERDPGDDTGEIPF